MRKNPEGPVYFLCIRVLRGIVGRIFCLGIYVAVNGLGYSGSAGGAGDPFFHLPSGKLTLVLHEMR